MIWFELQGTKTLEEVPRNKLLEKFRNYLKPIEKAKNGDPGDKLKENDFDIIRKLITSVRIPISIWTIYLYIMKHPRYK